MFDNAACFFGESFACLIMLFVVRQIVRMFDNAVSCSANRGSQCLTMLFVDQRIVCLFDTAVCYCVLMKYVLP